MSRVLGQRIMAYSRTSLPPNLKGLRILNWIVGIVAAISTPISYDIAVRMEQLYLDEKKEGIVREKVDVGELKGVFDKIYQQKVDDYKGGAFGSLVGYSDKDEEDEETKESQHAFSEETVDDDFTSPLIQSKEEKKVESVSKPYPRTTYEEAHQSALSKPSFFFGLSILPCATLFVFLLRRFAAKRCISSIWLQESSSPAMRSQMGIGIYSITGKVEESVYPLGTIVAKKPYLPNAYYLKLPKMFGYAAVDLTEGVVHDRTLLDRLCRGDESLRNPFGAFPKSAKRR